jgi:hypothetical protein
VHETQEKQMTGKAIHWLASAALGFAACALHANTSDPLYQEAKAAYNSTPKKCSVVLARFAEYKQRYANDLAKPQNAALKGSIDDAVVDCEYRMRGSGKSPSKTAERSGASFIGRGEAEIN